MANYERHTLDWQGILIEVRYCQCYADLGDFRMAHIEIESIEPARAVLPVTETGYRSHFVPEQEVIEDGGVLRYVSEALDEAAADPAWKAKEAAARQYSLL